MAGLVTGLMVEVDGCFWVWLHMSSGIHRCTYLDGERVLGLYFVALDADWGWNMMNDMDDDDVHNRVQLNVIYVSPSFLSYDQDRRCLY